MAEVRKPNYGARRLEAEIERYFAELESDPTRRGGPSDLLARLGLDMESAARLTGEDGRCGRAMRAAATRLRAHLETSPAWAGSNGSKAMFLIKQRLWDGRSYADKWEDGSGTTIHVLFGNGADTDEAFT